MKTPITTAQAMSHPDVALTINTLGKMADELREERDTLTARVAELEAASRLALDALERPHADAYLDQPAIAALKAVL